MREPNFMMPKRSPAFSSAPGLHAAHDAPREDADDLPKDDGEAAVIDPDFAALVGRRGVVVVRRQELPLAKVDLRDAARDRRCG